MRVGLSSSNAPCVTASQRLCAGAPEGAQTRSPRRIEGLHLTRKKWLRHQPAAHTLTELQAQLDAFRTYYNTVRPHRALHRRTPAEAYTARPEATATGIPLIDGHYRVRHDRVDINGRHTVRHDSRLHHIGLGRRHAGTPVLIRVHDLDVRMLSTGGELLRDLHWTGTGTTDHRPPTGTMSRHTCERRSATSQECPRATSYIAQRIPLRRR